MRGSHTTHIVHGTIMTVTYLYELFDLSIVSHSNLVEVYQRPRVISKLLTLKQSHGELLSFDLQRTS